MNRNNFHKFYPRETCLCDYYLPKSCFVKVIFVWGFVNFVFVEIVSVEIVFMRVVFVNVINVAVVFVKGQVFVKVVFINVNYKINYLCAGCFVVTFVKVILVKLSM